MVCLVLDGHVTSERFFSFMGEYSMTMKVEPAHVTFRFDSFEDDIGPDLVNFILNAFQGKRNEPNALKLISNPVEFNHFLAGPMQYYNKHVTFQVTNPKTLEALRQNTPRPVTVSFQTYLNDYLYYEELLNDLMFDPHIDNETSFRILSIAIEHRGREYPRGDKSKLELSLLIK